MEEGKGKGVGAWGMQDIGGRRSGPLSLWLWCVIFLYPCLKGQPKYILWTSSPFGGFCKMTYYLSAANKRIEPWKIGILLPLALFVFHNKELVKVTQISHLVQNLQIYINILSFGRIIVAVIQWVTQLDIWREKGSQGRVNVMVVQVREKEG